MSSVGRTVFLPFLAVAILFGVAVWLFIGGALTQPMATVLAACIVPILGFVGFRYQKYLDRGAAALEVRRKEYVEYVRLAHLYVEDEVRKSGSGLWTLSRQADLLYVIGSKEVAEKVSTHLMAAKYFGRNEYGNGDGLEKTLRESMDSTLFKLLKAMRDDLEFGSNFLSPTTRGL